MKLTAPAREEAPKSRVGVTETTAPTMQVAAIILTKDEEKHLPQCIQSLEGLNAEVYVVDSGSTDATVQIARDLGATVFSHPFANYAKQFNWALDNIPTRAPWILRIDADERLHPRLASELTRVLAQVPGDVTGLVVPLRVRFLGRDLRFGDAYPVWLLRLWRRGEGRCEDRCMDEHIVLAWGRTLRVHGDLIHDVSKNLTQWIAKHNWYATRECADIQSVGPSLVLDDAAGIRRRLKQSVYLRLPPFYRAFAYWFYRYFLRLGLLDGTPGLIYHFLQAFWYRFLVDAKLFEDRQKRRDASQAPAHRAKPAPAAVKS